MGRITDIKTQVKNRSRVSVFIDGEFACGLDAVAAASARLKVGDEISAEELSAVTRSGEINSAFERAVGYLSRELRSKREIETYLAGKSYSRDVIEETVAKLVSYGYLNDREYARCYIQSKSNKYGEYRISAELKKRGVDGEIINELLSETDESGALGVAEKYLRTHRNCDKLKLKRFLASRGFSWDAIGDAVDALEERGEFDCDTGSDD